MGDTTGRTGRFWTIDDNEAGDYDTHGRNTAWEYDADGRLISRNEPSPNGLAYQPLRDSYDAAGWLAQTTQTTSNRSPTNPNIIFTTATTKTETYDGTGQVVKEATTTQTTYYLHSSALGGQVIAEYDGSGARRNSYVLAGGERVARQGGGLFWRHANPVTGDVVETDSQGAVSGKETLEPAGVNLGDADPLAAQQGRGSEGGMSQPQMNKMYAQLLPPSLGGDALQVNVDGFQMSAYTAFNLISIGAAQVSTSSQSVMPIYSRSQQSYVGLAVYNAQAATNSLAFLGAGSLGYLPAGSSYTQASASSSRVGSARFTIPDPTRSAGRALTGTSSRRGRRRSSAWSSSAKLRRRSFKGCLKDVATLRSNLQSFLNDSDCGKFLKALVSQLPRKSWRTERFEGSYLDAFDRIVSRGGFWSEDMEYAGLTDPNTLTVNLNSKTVTPYINTELRWHQLDAHPAVIVTDYF